MIFSHRYTMYFNHIHPSISLSCSPLISYSNSHSSTFMSFFFLKKKNVDWAYEIFEIEIFVFMNLAYFC
jgi:hypothetical protein